MIFGMESIPDLLDQIFEHGHALHSIEEVLETVPPIEWAMVHLTGSVGHRKAKHSTH